VVWIVGALVLSSASVLSKKRKRIGRLSQKAKLLKTFVAAANALEGAGVPFFVAYGTAIGAHRDSDFIAWDDDVDLAVRYDDIARVFPDSDGNVDIEALDRVMRTKGFRKIKESGRYKDSWRCHKSHYPIVYKYRFRGKECDIFVLYRHDGFLWDFSKGRYRIKKDFSPGRKFPDIPLSSVKLGGRRVAAFPTLWLDLLYGDWRSPVKKKDPGGTADDSRLVFPPNHSGCRYPPPIEAPGREQIRQRLSVGWIVVLSVGWFVAIGGFFVTCRKFSRRL